MSSRRRRSRRHRGAIVAGVLVVAAAGAAATAVSTGLVVIHHGSDAPSPAPPPGAAALRDTSAGALDRAGPAPRDSLAGPAPAGLPPAAAPAPPPVAMPPAESAATESAAAGRAAGVGSPFAPAVATTGELSALAARLVVPVAGVAREKLVDSFDDARGARGADAKGGRRHDALDILAPRGTPVVAATSGRVLKLFDSKLGGLTVYTSDESERFILLYAHLDRYAPAVREGARVAQGDTIGYVGTTGDANPATPHLHFAIARAGSPLKWWQGTPVNPYPLLRGR